MDKNKKKIAVIGLKGLPAFGGAASVGENIIFELKEKYDFTVYATKSHTVLKTGEYKGSNLIVFKKIPFRKLNTLYYYIMSVFHALLFGKYEFIHLHHRDAVVLTILLKIKYPVVITTHGGHRGVSDKWKKFNWIFDLQVKYFLKYCDFITCVAKHEKRILKQKYNIDAHYIPNGGFIKGFNFVKSSLNNLPQDYIIFVAGRILSLKGLHILLDSLHLIKYNGSLLVVGDLTHEKKYNTFILKKAKGLNIQFTGLIKDKLKLYSIIKNSRYMVFPSIYEAMSMVLLETISIGIPVICSDIIENKDIFTNEEVLFFESNNAFDLSKKIKFAETYSEEMEKMAKKALSRIYDQYNWSKIVMEYDNIYQKVLNVKK